jgi:hypothetical protein
MTEIAPFPTTGASDLLPCLRQRVITERGAVRACLRIAPEQKQRSWDEQFWPHAPKGLFAVKRKIPSILAREGLC